MTPLDASLIAAYYTLSGGPVAEPAVHGFAERVAAAAQAGYSAIGLSYQDYEALMAKGWTPRAMTRALDDHGIRVLEIEFLTGWAFADDDPAARVAEERLYEMADVFRARHVNLGDVHPPGTLPPIDDVAARLASIADRAAQHGLLVALEFFPYAAIPDLATAWALVERAERANVGVLLDAWHFYRGDPDEDLLRSLPPEHIVLVQLADANKEVAGTLRADTRRRQLCGEGDLPLLQFLKAIRDTGASAPISVEIISEDLNAMPVREAAQRSVDTTRAVLADALGG